MMNNRSYLWIFTAILMTACSPSKQSALLSDTATDFSQNSLDTAPKESALSLTVKSNTGNIACSQYRIDIGGDCDVSTFPSNQITVSLKTAVTGIPNPMPIISLAVKNSGAVTNGVYTFNTSCEQGKFNLSIDRTGKSIEAINANLATSMRSLWVSPEAGSSQRTISLSVDLKAFDSAGGTHLGPSKTVSVTLAAKDQTIKDPAGAIMCPAGVANYR